MYYLHLIYETLNAALKANNALATVLTTFEFPEHQLPKFLRDHRTIRIDIGHGTGKSTAIMQHAQAGDAIVVDTDDTYRYFCEAIKDQNPSWEKISIYVASELGKSRIRAVNRHQRVWVNEPDRVLRHFYDLFETRSTTAFHDFFAVDRNQQFIFLG